MKRIFTFILLSILVVTAFAQAPQKLSYQAVIRNTSDQLVSNTTVGMQISILQGSATGTVVYYETQTPTTNANGLVSIEIGNGTGFDAIDWSNGPYFIKTETDITGGTNYTIAGTSELLSVPYALHAKTAESISGGIVETDPVFDLSAAATISATDIINWNNKLSVEVDGDVTNEIQILSISNDTIRLTNGGFIKLPAGFDGDYNSLVNKPTIPVVPTNVSSFTNDAGYLTSFTEVDGSVTNEIQILSISNDTIRLTNGGFVKLPAGFSGNYNDLTNKPTNVSTFTNDAGYLTSFTEVDGSITNEIQILSISNDTIRLTNGGFVKLPAGFDGDYNSLINKPTIPVVPTNVSSFTNDAGYLTSFTEVDGSITNEIQILSISNDTIRLTNGGFVKLPVGFDGQYSSLTGTPTNVSSFTNDAGYLTSFTEVDPEVGANTTNYISKWNGTSLISSTVYDDGTNVGIGTSTPAYKLDVSADAQFNGVRVGRGGGNQASNVMIGSYALMTNSSGFANTAVGYYSLFSNTTGSTNTAIGQHTLYANTIGKWNTALGCQALTNNIDGNSNTALGLQSLGANTTGDNNTAVGRDALLRNTTGNNSVALGQEAGFNGISGSNNIFLGYQAGYNEYSSNKLYIANSSTSTPLLYGDFSTATLTVYSNLNINNKYTFPSIDGTSGQILSTNGAGVVGWNSLATVATSGSYSDLSNTPTNVSSFANDAGFLTSFTEVDPEVGANTTNYVSKWNGTSLVTSTIFDNGNIGIGTTSPAVKLDVRGNVKIGASNSINIWDWDGVEKIGIDYNPVNGDFNMRNPVAGKRLLATITPTGSWGVEVFSGTELMRLTGSGNLGIGTTTPSTKLDVIGVITATGGNSTNWNTAFGWGNHAGLYRPASWVPDWTDVTNKPAFALVATSGSYSDLSNTPTNVSSFANDAGYLTSFTEVDGDVTNEIEMPVDANAGDMAYFDGSAWVKIPQGNDNQILTLQAGVPTWQNQFALPTATSTVATNVTATTATLNGIVNANGLSTTVTFEYGPTTSYGSTVTATQSPVTGNANTNVSADISGLVDGTTYYFRIKAENAIGIVYSSEMSFQFLSIGESYQGGIVAYILQAGDPGYDASIQHGIIAAPSDQSTNAQWGCINSLLCSEITTEGMPIGKGNQNTMEIINGCSTLGIAARLCGDLVLGGYDDWFLPSYNELMQLYLNKSIIGGLSNAEYWSSSEGTSWYAYTLNFSNGAFGYPNKDNGHYVRAVRAF